MQTRAFILFLCGILAVSSAFSQSRKECEECIELLAEQDALLKEGKALLAEQDSLLSECARDVKERQKDIERLIESNKVSYEKYLSATEDIGKYKFYAEQRLEEIKA